MRDLAEELKQMEAQLEQQNAELDQAFSVIRNLDDSVELAVPQAVLDELEESCTPRKTNNTPAFGAIRA